jgi:hypothetical protein
MPDVTYSGPLFDGRADRAVDVACGRINNVVADRGRDLVHIELGRVLRNPTGYYRSRVTTKRRGAYTDVTDQGVIYGNWLEGTGERNRTTRFKGYTTFRRVTARLNIEGDEIAEPVLQAHLDRMNI